MKLNSIELTNFRQFKGQQRFSLEPREGRTVSMIFAGNGVGKTTLLNAFTWALYGELSADVEAQERLITDCVWLGTKFGKSVCVAVEVVFEHEGRRYWAKRWADVIKSNDRQGRVAAPLLELRETDHDGNSVVVRGPQEKINSIMPQPLSRFFFFNGERIEKLVHGKAYAEVKQDIKTLLGLKQVERALDHLPRVNRKLSKELKKYGGEQAAEIQTSIEDIEDSLRAGKTRLGDHEVELAALGEEREEVLELLRQHDGAGPLQSQRDAVIYELDVARKSLISLEDERRFLLATKGFLAFTGDISDCVAGIADDLHERGALPAPLKREFVESLLAEGRCICGTELGVGSSAERNVRAWREKAGLAEVEAAWQRMSGDIASLKDARSDLSRTLQQTTSDICATGDRIDELEHVQTELDGKLKGLPMEEVARLEMKRKDLEGRIANSNQSIGVLRKELADSEGTLAKLRGQLKSAQVADELAIVARNRLQVVQDVADALGEILDIRATDMRVRLDAKVKKVFSRIAIKPYFPALNEEFELGLYFDAGGGELLPVPKSTGENQILSLSFVAAVSQLAQEVRRERQAEGGVEADAGSYPLVMDAAFGSLDVNYQREVSRALALMAPQMVVLVSKSQGQGNVLNELRPHLSSLGVMVSHSTNTSQPKEKIELEGHEYPYIETGADLDWSELMEVRI